jgi:hypothetical protein
MGAHIIKWSTLIKPTELWMHISICKIVVIFQVLQVKRMMMTDTLDWNFVLEAN